MYYIDMKKYQGEKANTLKFKLNIHFLQHNWCPCCIFLIQYGFPSRSVNTYIHTYWY